MYCWQYSQNRGSCAVRNDILLTHKYTLSLYRAPRSDHLTPCFGNCTHQAVGAFLGVADLDERTYVPREVRKRLSTRTVSYISFSREGPGVYIVSVKLYIKYKIKSLGPRCITYNTNTFLHQHVKSINFSTSWTLMLISILSNTNCQHIPKSIIVILSTADVGRVGLF